MNPAASPPKSTEYVQLLDTLKERIRSSRLRAALAVNEELILLYSGIGHDILDRQDVAGWGARTVDRLSADLKRSFPEMTGLSPRNLKYMRALADAFPDREIVQRVIAQLPWGHAITLLETIKDPAQRIWYGEQARENFPLMSMVKVRIDIERELRALVEDTGMATDHPMGLNELIRTSEDVRQFPSTAEFMLIVSSLQKATHGVDVPQDEADRATKISTRFLANIRGYRATR